MNMPIRWVLLCAIVTIVLAGFWFWRKNRKRASADDHPASIVILLQKPRPLNVQVLAQLLSQATGRSVRAIGPDESDPSNAPAGDVVAGESPHFIAHVGGTSFIINNLPSPYVEDPIAASESIPELRLRKAMSDHKAWISMDFLSQKEATPAAYRVVAHVMSNFAGPDCLALYHPPLNRLVPCSEETAQRLRSDDPIKAVFNDLDLVPVIPVDDDDPRLKAAEAEARRRFPEFEAAFTKKDGTDFSIKARISSETNSEHILGSR